MLSSIGSSRYEVTVSLLPSSAITSSPRLLLSLPVWTTGVRPLTTIASFSSVWLWPLITTSMPGTSLARRTSSPAS